MTLSQHIEVLSVVPPKVSRHSTANTTISVEVGNNFTLSCGFKIRGVPKPTVTWTKNGQKLRETVIVSDSSGDYFQYTIVSKRQNESLQFFATPLSYSKARDLLPEKQDLEGKYMCTIANRGGIETVFTEVLVKQDNTQTVIWAVSSICGILVACVCILGIFYTYHR